MSPTPTAIANSFLPSDLAGQYAGYETLRELSARPVTTVVAGHDPAVMERFTALDGDRAGLAVQIG